MENVKRTLQSCGEKAVYDSKTNKEPFEVALKRHLSYNTNLLCANFKSDGLFRQYAYPDNRFVSVGSPEKNKDGMIFPFEIKLDFGNRVNEILDIDSIKDKIQKDSYCRNDAIQNVQIPKISLQQKQYFENQKKFNNYSNRQIMIEKYQAIRTEVTIGPNGRNAGYGNNTQQRGNSSSGLTNPLTGLDVIGHTFAIEDLYNNFFHNHLTYKTTTGVTKDIFTSSGAIRSARAAKFASASKFVRYAGTFGTGLMTGVSGYNIVDDISHDRPVESLDVADFSVGSIGLIVWGISMFTPIGWVATVAAAGVAIYCGGRLTYDLCTTDW